MICRSTVNIVLAATLLITTTSIVAVAGATVTDSLINPEAANTVIINFNGLTGADGSPFASYKEYGFSIIPRRPSNWLNGGHFGDPAPFIYFDTSGPATTNSIFVSHGGARFSFIAIDLYSSVTDIPYVFRGFLNGLLYLRSGGRIRTPSATSRKL